MIDFICAVADVVQATKFEWVRASTGLWNSTTPPGFTVGVNLWGDCRGNVFFATLDIDGTTRWDLRPIPTLDLAKEACERYWRGDLTKLPESMKGKGKWYERG